MQLPSCSLPSDAFSPRLLLHSSICSVVAVIVTVFFAREASAQLSPFEVSAENTNTATAVLPDLVPADSYEFIQPSQRTTIDSAAALMNRRLREFEEKQADIVDELKTLPSVSREEPRLSAFGYHSGNSKQRPKWVQIDLMREVEVSAVSLFPVTAEYKGKTAYGYGFPRSFRIDVSMTDDFQEYETVAEGRTPGDLEVRRYPYFKKMSPITARYIRVTATDLWQGVSQGSAGVFALSEMMVFENSVNVAVGGTVTSHDSEERYGQWSRRFLNDGVIALGLPEGMEESGTYGFRGRSEKPARESWVQVDLGTFTTLDEALIIFSQVPEAIPDPTVRFPNPIRVHIGSLPDMSDAKLVASLRPQQLSQLGKNPFVIGLNGKKGRYIRLTVQSDPKPKPIDFQFAELQVYSDGENMARGMPVTASHPVRNARWSPEFLVDGFTSRANLLSYEEWLAMLDRRQRLLREWRALESDRVQLVNRFVTQALVLLGLLLFVVIVSVVITSSRGRKRRRKDLEDLRQRIASDLHDDIGSNLSSIALLAELGKTEANEPDLVVEELSEIKATADKTIESMRDIVWLIRPGEETWSQMVARFRETAAKLMRAHEYTFNIEGEAHDDRLPLEFKRDLFLIFKETLNNIVRHAKAKNVAIDLQCERHKLALTVVDDGQGFDTLDADFREGNGLRNLRMRAQAIGGDITMDSAAGEGTTVTLNVPIP